MSRHSEISQDLGWDHPPLHYPSLSKAKEDAEKASNGDEQAYRNLLAWNRFLTHPRDRTEIDIMRVILDGLKEAEGWFK